MKLTLLSPFFNHLSRDSSHYFDTSSLGIIALEGKNAENFLQNQCTLNVLKLQPNQCKISAICNLQGRVVSLFYLLKQEEKGNYYLLINKSLIEPTIHFLKKYAVFHKIKIHDVSDQCHLAGFLQAEKVVDQNHYYLNHEIGFNFNLQSPNSLLPQNVLSETEWDILLMTNHYPRLNENDIGKWLPFELGLQNLAAIDFDKGCYLGQEIIARIHYRSKKQFETLLTEIKYKQNPLYGDIVDQNKKIIGTVIDVIPLKDSYLSLITVKDHEEKGPLFLSKEEMYDIKILNMDKTI